MTVWLASWNRADAGFQLWLYGKIISQFYFPDNPCRRSPCLNNGTCQLSGDIVCDCPENFGGDFCEIFLSGE